MIISIDSSKLDGINSCIGQSDLLIVASKSDMENRIFVLNIVKKICCREKKSALFFSSEMLKDQLAMEFIALKSDKVTMRQIGKGSLNLEKWENIIDAVRTLSALPIYIDDTLDITDMDIRTKIENLRKKSDLGLIIIDSLQSIKADNKRKITSDDETKKISDMLKQIAEEFQIPIIVFLKI